jgi:hypothetical protein
MKRNHFSGAMAPLRFFRNVFFTSALLIAGAVHASAQQTPDTARAAASVRYLGYQNDLSSFLLQYETPDSSTFTVTIQDAEGYTLFNQNFTEKKFSKIFKTPLELGPLTFIISNPADKTGKKFQASTERRVVEAFSITKAN